MTNSATTIDEVGPGATDWHDGNGAVAPVPLPDDHPGGLAGAGAGGAKVRIVSMTWSRCHCGSCGGPDGDHFQKPILTFDEAARMLSVSRKRLESIVFEEKRRLGRLPDFVCDAGGKMRRRVLTAELMEWVKTRRSRRGRPTKTQGRG